MESQALRSAVRRLCRVVASSPPAGPDAELVRAFVGRRDAGAFEQIVRRHGPMVLGVCRRVLRDPADADDAFQATFLVLVRKAGSLRAPDRLAGWLHQVAHRTARKAWARRRDRARREGEMFDVPAGEPPAEFVWRELRPIFDAELDRLPDRLRLPAVLCLLEGQSKAEAARALGWPEGTVSCRLQRARERLRMGLAARGLTLSAGALAAALFEGAGTAAVPDRLIVSTVQGVTSPAVAAGVQALADGVAQAMFQTKVKAVAAAVLVAGLVGTGTGVVLVPYAGSGQVAAREADPQAPPKDSASDRRAADPKSPADPVEAARIKSAVADSDAARSRATAEAALRELRKLRLDALKAKAKEWEPLVKRGVIPRSEWDGLHAQIAKAEDELRPTPADPDRALKAQELELLKERLAWEEQMVKKGFLTESQVKKTRLEVARAEAALAKADAQDPRRKALEDVIDKLEQIAKQAEEGHQRGVVPRSELLNAQANVLEYRFKLIEMFGPPADPRGVAIPSLGLRELEAKIGGMERDLARAETLAKQGTMSVADVRRLRNDLGGLRAEAATARADYAAAVKHREAVVAEQEAHLTMVRKLFERKDTSQSDLRAVEVDVAEARVEALKAAVRQQLAGIVSTREADLRDVQKLYESKAVSGEEVRRAERALAEARARLSTER